MSINVYIRPSTQGRWYLVNIRIVLLFFGEKKMKKNKILFFMWNYINRNTFLLHYVFLHIYERIQGITCTI